MKINHRQSHFLLIRLPTVDVVFSSKRAASSESEDIPLEKNDLEQILEYMKDFILNAYHPFSGKSKVHLVEDIRSGQLQTRNAFAVSVHSISFNISQTRYTLIQIDGELLNRIQLSVIGQISKARFEYDIRRFSGILTFPMIWYNRSLTRRLFLGEENLSTQMSSTITPLIMKSNNVQCDG